MEHGFDRAWVEDIDTSLTPLPDGFVFKGYIALARCKCGLVFHETSGETNLGPSTTFPPKTIEHNKEHIIKLLGEHVFALSKTVPESWDPVWSEDAG